MDLFEFFLIVFWASWILMSVLSHLEPKKVFSFFEELCAIPHGSGNTAQISDYCVNFAKERGLESHQDVDPLMEVINGE